MVATFASAALLLLLGAAPDVERAVRLKSTSRLKEMLTALDIDVPKRASKDQVRELAVRHDVIARYAEKQQMALPKSSTGSESSSAVGGYGPCKSFCKGSCCYFSDPARDCSGCDASWTCNPSAECYTTGSGHAPSDFGPASERCSPLCRESTCKSFSTPEAECAGCSASSACHPGARYYREGSGVRDEL